MRTSRAVLMALVVIAIALLVLTFRGGEIATKEKPGSTTAQPNPEALAVPEAQPVDVAPSTERAANGKSSLIRPIWDLPSAERLEAQHAADVLIGELPGYVNRYRAIIYDVDAFITEDPDTVSIELFPDVTCHAKKKNAEQSDGSYRWSGVCDQIGTPLPMGLTVSIVDDVPILSGRIWMNTRQYVVLTTTPPFAVVYEMLPNAQENGGIER